MNLFGLDIKWNNKNGYVKREEFQEEMRNFRRELKIDINTIHTRIDDIFKILGQK